MVVRLVKAAAFLSVFNLTKVDEKCQIVGPEASETRLISRHIAYAHFLGVKIDKVEQLVDGNVKYIKHKGDRYG